MSVCDPLWLPAQPYATAADLPCDCKKVDTGSTVYEWALMAASRRVYEVTFGQFPGCFETKIRPCRKVCSTLHERLAQQDALRRQHSLPPAMPFIVDGGPAPLLVNLWACDCAEDPCSCGGVRDFIVLPYRPVREVLEVLLDGEVFTAWELVGAKLYRTDGLPWPTCNAPLADTEPGTWSVRFSHGVGLPPEGAALVALYACELAKMACKEKCDLPDGIRVVSRPGVEYGVLDYRYRSQNLTGYIPLDDWLNVLLGGNRRAREQPRIWSARRARQRPTHRVESQVPILGGPVEDEPFKETLRLRSNDALEKIVRYPGRMIEHGRLAVKDADGNVVLDVMAEITDGVARFELVGGNIAPFPTDNRAGTWDMIVQVVGGSPDVVAAGPVRFVQGVTIPEF